MIRFYFLRVVKDYLGHIILIGLPVVLITLMVLINQNIEASMPRSEMALYIGFVYIIMFQWFGSAYTFEGIEHDFFTPFRHRLRATPVNPIRFVLANIAFGVIISYLQTLVILLYVVVMYQATIPNILLVLVVLLLGAILAQLIAALTILWLKKASKAQALITVFIIFSMVIAGLFVPLPSTNFTDFMASYSSPLAWGHTTIEHVMANDFQSVVIPFGLLITGIIMASYGTYKASQKVIT